MSFFHRFWIQNHGNSVIFGPFGLHFSDFGEDFGAIIDPGSVFWMSWEPVFSSVGHREVSGSFREGFCSIFMNFGVPLGSHFGAICVFFSMILWARFAGTLPDRFGMDL